MPTELFGVALADVHAKIKVLIEGMVNIRDKTGEFLLRLDDGRVIDTKGWHDWEWTHGVGLYGIWQYYELTGDPAWLRLIEDWFAARFAAGGTTKNVNTMAVFLTLACVYERTRNPAYRPWLDTWAEWAYHDLARTRHGAMQHVTYSDPHRQQLWDDTVVMTVLPLAKIGVVLARPHYLAEARRQFLLHVQYLFDPPTGLFFHGWEFTDTENGTRPAGHHFAKARWARGNSWVTMAIPEFLELLLLDHSEHWQQEHQDPVAAFLRGTLQAQCEALRPLQAPSGLWRTLLDVPENEGSYQEASSTAGFAFGVLKAQRRRLIGPEFDDMAVRAVKGLLANISPEGELLNTSFGTAVGRDLQHYKDIPITSMPYGQAMAIMALVEFARRYI